jgi:hypothetical protein
LCRLVDPAGPDYDPRYIARLTAPPSYPGIGQQLASVARAAGRVVAAIAAGEPVLAPAEVVAARVAVCDLCPEWDRARDRCLKCGCHSLKRSLLTERCPLAKWPE